MTGWIPSSLVCTVLVLGPDPEEVDLPFPFPFFAFTAAFAAALSEAPLLLAALKTALFTSCTVSILTGLAAFAILARFLEGDLGSDIVLLHTGKGLVSGSSFKIYPHYVSGVHIRAI